MAAEIPNWVNLLKLAKEWGIPPWELEEHCPMLWYLRWQIYHAEINRGIEDRETHN